MSDAMVNVEEVLAHREGVPVKPPVEALALPEGRAVKIKLTQAELYQRRMEMAAMQAKGKYLRTIAAKFGVSESTVSAEIQKLVSEYRAEALKSVGERIAQEEHLIYLVQLEAVQAWFESKLGKVTNIRKRVSEIRSITNLSGHGRKGKQPRKREASKRIEDELNEIFGEGLGVQNDRDEQTDRTEESAGDPAFLKIILECSDRRAKLNNLYPNSNGNGSGGRPGEDDDFQTWTPDQRLARLKSHLEKARLNRATSMAIKGASSRANVEALNAAPLQGIFQQRAQQMAEGRLTQPTADPELEAAWDATK